MLHQNVLFRKNPHYKAQKCVLCGETFVGFGNNPAPVKQLDEGKCCDVCNDTIVIPKRIEQILNNPNL